MPKYAYHEDTSEPETVIVDKEAIAASTDPVELREWMAQFEHTSAKIKDHHAALRDMGQFNEQRFYAASHKSGWCKTGVRLIKRRLIEIGEEPDPRVVTICTMQAAIAKKNMLLAVIAETISAAAYLEFSEEAHRRLAAVRPDYAAAA